MCLAQGHNAVGVGGWDGLGRVAVVHAILFYLWLLQHGNAKQILFGKS